MLVPLETAVLIVGTLLTTILALWWLVERPVRQLIAVPVSTGRCDGLLRKGQTVQWRSPGLWHFYEVRRGSPDACDFVRSADCLQFERLL
jgi:hypothetical protein